MSRPASRLPCLHCGIVTAPAVPPCIRCAPCFLGRGCRTIRSSVLIEAIIRAVDCRNNLNSADNFTRNLTSSPHASYIAARSTVRSISAASKSNWERSCGMPRRAQKRPQKREATQSGLAARLHCRLPRRGPRARGIALKWVCSSADSPTIPLDLRKWLAPSRFHIESHAVAELRAAVGCHPPSSSAS